MSLQPNVSQGSISCGHRLLLADPDDEGNLTELLCLVRRQIEYFPATAEDVDARSRKGGRKGPFEEGRVGIRCIHCAHLPFPCRTKGAVSYPKSTTLVYQAVRNWQRYHLPSCPFIPDEVKLESKRFKRQHSGAEINRYWIESCKRKGLVDAASPKDGIRFADGTAGTAGIPTDAGTKSDAMDEMATTHAGGAPAVLPNSYPERIRITEVTMDGESAAILSSAMTQSAASNTLESITDSMNESQRNAVVVAPSASTADAVATFSGSAIQMSGGDDELLSDATSHLFDLHVGEDFNGGRLDSLRLEMAPPPLLPAAAIATRRPSEDTASSPSQMMSTPHQAHSTSEDEGTHPAAPGRVLLYSPSDDDFLSDLVCLLRAQLEVFAATPDDVDARIKRGDISLGRVGIRCIHCCHIPHKERAKGAVSYPNSIRIMNQAVRNWQRYHFLACGCIPERLKEKYRSIKGKRVHSSKASMEYWIDSCKNMGMVDRKGGIFFKSDLDGFDAGGVEAANSALREEGEGDDNVAANGCVVKHKKSHDRQAAHAEEVVSHLKPSTSDNTGDLDQVDFDLEADIDSWMDMKISAEDDSFMLQIQEEDKSSMSSSSAADLETPARDALHAVAESDVHTENTGNRIDSDEHNDIGNRQANGVLPSESWPVPINGHKEVLMEEQKEGNGIRVKDENSGAIQKVTPSAHTYGPLNVSESSLYNPQQEVATDALVGRIVLAHDIVKTSREMRQVPSGSPGEQDGADSRNDLFALGVELYELFADRHPFESGEDGVMQESDPSMAMDDLHSEDVPRKKRGKLRISDRPYIPLVELGLPTSLCNLVSSLLDSCNDDVDVTQGYRSVAQVEEDLLQMSTDPQRFLLDPDMQTISGKLDFPCDKVFGQEANAAKLLRAYDCAITPGQACCEMVLISGNSGTGKSSLVRQVQGPLVDRGGCFISGKFDEMRQVQPMSAIVDAFNEYCDILLTKEDESLRSARAAIKEAVGGDGKVLTDLIPRLCEVIGHPGDSSVTLGGKEAQNRLMFFFRKFLRTISNPSHPVILFLDDLQWADEASLEVIRAFVTDAEVKSLLFLGCYRDNEVGDGHPLKAQLGSIVVSGASFITIKIGNMDKETVNLLVSETLHMAPRLTEPLTSIVFQKTDGNGLFVRQFLLSLCDEGLLHFSLMSRQWEWDLDDIKAKAMADNVVELMKDKMLDLAPGIQWGLKIAACLGAQCDESTLRFLDVDIGNCEGMSDVLDIAVEEGLMFKVGTTYSFAHDAIQEAAYSLIPESERKAMHLQIGLSLWKRASEEELDSILFVVVDQIYRGSDLINDDSEKMEAVRLFLRAGERAISTSAFLPASIYLLQGIELLGEDDWTNHYDLSIQLYSACSETYYVMGNFDGLAIVSNPILENARCLQDKLRVYYTLVSSLAAEGKLLDAIKFGLGVLEQLGESFPDEIDESVIMRYIGETKGMLQGTDTDTILDKDGMQDESKHAAMQFLSIVTFYAFFGQPLLVPVTSSRMVQLSLSYGVCKESAVGFALFAVVLCISVEDARQGYVLGKLASCLVKKFEAREFVARVWVALYGLVNIFFEPVQASVDSLKFGHEVGMSTGDVSWAMSNAFTFGVSALQCGRQLEPLADELRSYSLQMKEHNQHVFRMMTAIYEQAVLNLMSTSEEDDPTHMAGEATDHQDLLIGAIETQNWNGVSHIYFVRMWLAYLFRRYDLAAEMAEQRRRSATFQRGATLVNEIFYTALIALASAKDGDESKSRSIAQDAAEKMKAWAENSKWNFQHKLELLKAEIAFADGDVDAAAKAYDDAIHLAGEHGFVNEQALACERAGIFFSQAFNPLIAPEYFSRAHKLYLQWGAKRKALDLLKHIGKAD